MSKTDRDEAGWLQRARAHWRWRGTQRPPWAVEPGPGQVSVWDFPRPPRVVAEPREVVVRWGDIELARTRRALAVHETGHPPTVYLPWDDVQRHWLQPAGGGSFCEWKGPAHYWTVADGARSLPRAAWSYPKPLPDAPQAAALAQCVAFYAAPLACHVDGQRVLPQPGGFYGGWITPELVGPFKGEPGSEGW